MITPFSACFFFFNDTATTEIYTLSLHDALPISLDQGHPRPHTGRHVREHRVCRREVDRRVVARERRGEPLRACPRVRRGQHRADFVSGGARLRDDDAPHAPVPDERESHARTSVATASACRLRASCTYSSTPRSRSAFAIRSPAVWASWIEPGPTSSGAPQFERWGTSVVKPTTHVSKPGRAVSRTGGVALRYSIRARPRTAPSSNARTGAASGTGRMCSPA